MNYATSPAPPASMQLTERHVVIAAVVLAIIVFMLYHGAMAGTDTTFSVPMNKVQAWVNGSYGKMVAVGALAVGLAVSIVKQSLMFVAAGAGIGIAASAGPAVVMGMMTMTL